MLETSLVGEEVAEPEDKRFRNAWEALWVGVIFAGGLAVSFGAAGMCRQGSLTPGSSHCQAPWVQLGTGAAGVGLENKFVAFLLPSTGVFGCCLLLCAPGRMCLCPPSSPQCLGAVRNQLKRGFGGENGTGRV